MQSDIGLEINPQQIFELAVEVIKLRNKRFVFNK
jgi:hypothetical protein